MIGERKVHENARAKPGGIEFSPTGGRGCLAGDLLGEEYIAVMEPSGTGELLVTVGLHAGKRSFDITVVDDQGERGDSSVVSIEKDAVLNALIYKGSQKDGQGRVVLARARMRKKS
jgi:hypothetical protein